MKRWSVLMAVISLSNTCEPEKALGFDETTSIKICSWTWLERWHVPSSAGPGYVLQDPDIDYKMTWVVPDPRVDYKMLIDAPHRVALAKNCWRTVNKNEGASRLGEAKPLRPRHYRDQ